MVYSVTYDNLYDRIAHTSIQIILLALGGIIVGVVAAVIFSKSITSALSHLKLKAEEIGAGNLDIDIEVQSQDEVGVLAETLENMVSDLKESQSALLENEKHTHEIELAAEIQQDLLPTDDFNFHNIDVAATIRPADEVGGDIYDIIPLSDKEALFYVGDVSGHGVPAGLISGMTNILVYGLVNNYQKVSDLVLTMNGALAAKTSKGKYVTMMMGRWHDERRQLIYTMGGHEPALFWQAKTGKFLETEKGGSPLGMIKKPLRPYTEYQLQIEPGDVLVVYTDGVNEAWNKKNQQFGMERFQEAVACAAAQKMSATEVLREIMRAVDEFRNGFIQKDDITLLVIVGK